MTITRKLCRYTHEWNVSLIEYSSHTGILAKFPYYNNQELWEWQYSWNAPLAVATLTCKKKIKILCCQMLPCKLVQQKQRCHIASVCPISLFLQNKQWFFAKLIHQKQIKILWFQLLPLFGKKTRKTPSCWLLPRKLIRQKQTKIPPCWLFSHKLVQQKQI